MEAKRAENNVAIAKAEAERWEAERPRKETLGKARIESVDLIEKLLDQGVKADDLPHRSTIIERAGVSAEGLTESLDKYSSIEALARSRRKESDEIKVKDSALDSQVKALTQERQDLQAAIRAVGEEGLRQVKKIGNQVTRAVPPWSRRQLRSAVYGPRRRT